MLYIHRTQEPSMPWCQKLRIVEYLLQTEHFWRKAIRVMILEELPADVLVDRILPHLGMLDLESLAQTSIKILPSIKRFLKALTSDDKKLSLSRGHVVFSALSLFEKPGQDVFLGIRHLHVVAGPLLQYIEYISSGQLSAISAMHCIAVEICWKRLLLSSSCKNSFREWFTSAFCPAIFALKSETIASLLFSVLEQARQHRFPFNTNDIVLFIRLYYERTSCISCIRLATNLMLNCVENITSQVIAGRGRKRRRREVEPNEDTLNPAQILTALYIQWRPDAILSILRALRNEIQATKFETILAQMHQYARFDIVTKILQAFEPNIVCRVLQKIRAKNQLGPHAIAAYVHAVSRYWGPASKNALIDSVSQRYHSTSRAKFLNVLGQLGQTSTPGAD